MLCLGYDAAFARPAAPSLVAQLLEEAFRFTAVPGFSLNLGQFICDQGLKPWIASEFEDIVNAVSLTPGHQLIAAEA